MRYTTAQHKGSLEECLKTEQPISEKSFKILTKEIYELYCYDRRINAYRYILKDMENNIGLPTWIHEYK